MGRNRAKTPSSLSLLTRIVRFDYAGAMRSNRYWHGNDPVTTHFFNGLQALFPEGERFFMDAARDVRDQIGKDKLPKALDEQIAPTEPSRSDRIELLVM